ncbi:MAG: N-acetylneuraminate synthase family protein [Pirellulales bacterium]
MVDAAAWAGADAVKVVKRELVLRASARFRNPRYHSPHSFGETYARHREALELSLEDYARLAQRARSHGLHFVATVCDIPSAQAWRRSASTPSRSLRDLNNLPLLEYVCSLGKPVILSTGMSTWDEIDAAAQRDAIRRSFVRRAPMYVSLSHARRANASAQHRGVA